MDTNYRIPGWALPPAAEVMVVTAPLPYHETRIEPLPHRIRLINGASTVAGPVERTFGSRKPETMGVVIGDQEGLLVAVASSFVFFNRRLSRDEVKFLTGFIYGQDADTRAVFRDELHGFVSWRHGHGPLSLVAEKLFRLQIYAHLRAKNAFLDDNTLELLSLDIRPRPTTTQVIIIATRSAINAASENDRTSAWDVVVTMDDDLPPQVYGGSPYMPEELARPAFTEGRAEAVGPGLKTAESGSIKVGDGLTIEGGVLRAAVPMTGGASTEQPSDGKAQTRSYNRSKPTAKGGPVAAVRVQPTPKPRSGVNRKKK